MLKAILGKKVGMTQIFTEDGAMIPVTVVEAGPVCYASQNCRIRWICSSTGRFW